jgi:hypothetical protein
MFTSKVFIGLWLVVSLLFAGWLLFGNLADRMYDFWKDSPFRCIVIPPFGETKPVFKLYIKIVSLIALLGFGVVFAMILRRLT